MPKQTRWAVKRGIDQAINNIEKAQENLAKVGILYETHHPDYFAKFKAIVTNLEMLKTISSELRDII